METARTLHARTYLHSNLSLSSQDNFNREIVISVGQALTDHKLLFLLLIFFFHSPFHGSQVKRRRIGLPLLEIDERDTLIIMENSVKPNFSSFPLG
jgi:hypothetical protein